MGDGATQGKRPYVWGDPADGDAIVWNETLQRWEAAASAGTYVPLLDKRITSIAYNADSTVQSVAYNGGPTITYTYNADGTVHTSSDGTTTRTFAYNADGSIASVA